MYIDLLKSNFWVLQTIYFFNIFTEKFGIDLDVSGKDAKVFQ